MRLGRGVNEITPSHDRDGVSDNLRKDVARERLRERRAFPRPVARLSRGAGRWGLVGGWAWR